MTKAENELAKTKWADMWTRKGLSPADIPAWESLSDAKREIFFRMTVKRGK